MAGRSFSRREVKVYIIYLIRHYLGDFFEDKQHYRELSFPVAKAVGWEKTRPLSKLTGFLLSKESTTYLKTYFLEVIIVTNEGSFFQISNQRFIAILFQTKAH